MKAAVRTRSAARIRRHTRVRKRVSGVEERPRLSVFRSNRFIYAQLIDDVAGKTLLSASDQGASSGSKTDRAAQVGGEIAALAKAKGIGSVVFDRGGYRFIGRVKALAEGARGGGLQF
ncbi:MAG: 50S ribosomal protein L18 [Chloroflexota bacterium]|nr:50S ribosomal protein L18 [Chloroflexota bacterium]